MHDCQPTAERLERPGAFGSGGRTREGVLQVPAPAPGVADMPPPKVSFANASTTPSATIQLQASRPPDYTGMHAFQSGAFRFLASTSQETSIDEAGLRSVAQIRLIGTDALPFTPGKQQSMLVATVSYMAALNISATQLKVVGMAFGSGLQFRVVCCGSGVHLPGVNFKRAAS